MKYWHYQCGNCWWTVFYYSFLLSQIKILKIIKIHEKCNKFQFGHHWNFVLRTLACFSVVETFWKRRYILKFQLCFLKIRSVLRANDVWLKCWKITLITDLPNAKRLVVLYIPQAFHFYQEEKSNSKMSEFWAKRLYGMRCCNIYLLLAKITPFLRYRFKLLSKPFFINPLTASVAVI